MEYCQGDLGGSIGGRRGGGEEGVGVLYARYDAIQVLSEDADGGEVS